VELFNTGFANLAIAEGDEITCVVAEMASGPVLLENDSLALYKDFNGILNLNAQHPAQFHGQYNAP
jgi:hypothetical protein